MQIRMSVTKGSVAVGQVQITVTGPKGMKISKAAPQLVNFTLKGREFSLVQGDSHAIWGSHQANDEQFTMLYNALSRNVGKVLPVEATYTESAPISAKVTGTISEDDLEF